MQNRNLVFGEANLILGNKEGGELLETFLNFCAAVFGGNQILLGTAFLEAGQNHVIPQTQSWEHDFADDRVK